MPKAKIKRLESNDGYDIIYPYKIELKYGIRIVGLIDYIDLECNCGKGLWVDSKFIDNAARQYTLLISIDNDDIDNSYNGITAADFNLPENELFCNGQNLSCIVLHNVVFKFGSYIIQQHNQICISRFAFDFNYILHLPEIPKPIRI